MAITSLDTSTYKIAITSDTKPTVVVGGTSTAKCVPNANISFACDSGSEKYYLNLNRKSVTVTSEKESLANDELKLTVGDETDIWHVVDGKLKWDIEIAKKPATNVFDWELTGSAGLSFYYQPALTQDEINGGCVRPDNVVGSYAVYCDKAHHIKDSTGKTLVNYRVGKLCHIYRPLCYDSKGTKVWGELLIESGTLRITIPQKFLDDAVYPVTLDPTIFGDDSNGASSQATAQDLRGNKFTSGNAGTADSMFVYIAAGAVAENSQCGYYTASDDAFVKATQGKVGGTDAAYNQYDFAAPKPAISGATDYYLCVEQWDPGGWAIAYDSGAGSSYTKLNFISDAADWVTPFDGTKATGTVNVYSIYCSYTESGEAQTITGLKSCVHGNKAKATLALLAGAKLTLKSATHSMLVTRGAFNLATALDPMDVVHAQLAQRFLVAIEQQLSVRHTVHGDYSDIISLLTDRALTVKNVVHAMLSADPSLKLNAKLNPTDTVHQLLAGIMEMLVPGAQVLIVKNAAHGQYAVLPQLTLDNLLGVDSTVHGQHARLPQTVQTVLLAVRSALHADLAGQADLAAELRLAAQSAVHALCSKNNITVNAAVALLVANCVHAMLAGNVVLAEADTTWLKAFVTKAEQYTYMADNAGHAFSAKPQTISFEAN